MTDRIRTAADLAARLHAEQVDKAGKPYIGHLARVAGILAGRFPDASEAEQEAAWLHDALEDTEATTDRLRAAGVSAEGHSDHPACDEAGGGRLSGLDCGLGEIRERRRHPGQARR